MYSREEILGMVAGPLLDHLVMTTVFEARRGYYGDEAVWYHHDENGVLDYEWKFNNSPSTDIAAAYEVIDHLNKTSHRAFVIEIGGIDNPTFVWKCTIKDVCSVEASTSPLAISKAALLSLLKED